MSDEYDAKKDNHDSYFAAVAAKRARGDTHWPVPASQKATLTLPWPDSNLSPNAHVGWRKKAKTTKAARSIAAWEATLNKEFERLKGAKAICVTAIFSPPDARRRDTDNMLASIKPYLDGISDVIGVDDSTFQLAAPVRADPVKHGAVKIMLEVA